jgi:hypothetical protein
MFRFQDGVSAAVVACPRAARAAVLIPKSAILAKLAHCVTHYVMRLPECLRVGGAGFWVWSSRLVCPRDRKRLIYEFFVDYANVIERAQSR